MMKQMMKQWLRQVAVCVPSVACMGMVCILLTPNDAGATSNSEKELRPRVFINPGHGGHDNNDRPEPFFNEGMQSRVPYYESDSNFNEGMALFDILKEKGYEVYISRYKNTSAGVDKHTGAQFLFAIGGCPCIIWG